MKYTGLLLLFFCCTGIGFYAAYQVRKNIKLYELCLLLTEDCMTYIRYQHLPLPELFGLLKEKQSYQKWDFIRNLEFSPEISPETLWNQALQNSQLPREARESLQHLGTELGRTDMQGQIAALTLCQHQIQAQLAACRTDCQKKSKLYQTLGALGGAAVIVVFL